MRQFGTLSWLCLFLPTWFCIMMVADGFFVGDVVLRRSGQTSQDTITNHHGRFQAQMSDDEESVEMMTNTAKKGGKSRRDMLSQTVGIGFSAALSLLVDPQESEAVLPVGLGGDLNPMSSKGYIKAQRCKSYFVDSTIPPTLVPFRDGRQAAILKNLGSGLGTQKTPLIDDAINLNNILNKTIAAGIDTISPDLAEQKRQISASFVVLGLDTSSAIDATLARDLARDIMKPRSRLASALGLSWIPQSLQYVLRDFRTSRDVSMLKQKLLEAKLPPSIIEAQIPLMEWATTQKITLVALAPELEDMQIVRTQGLQNVDLERRAIYVADSQGFIQLTQNPTFKLYADRSMLKEFTPLSADDKTSDYFAQQILFDETVATAAARWALLQPDESPLMMIVSDFKDARFMGGANSRIPRVCRYLSPDSVIDEKSVTSIMINPTAQNTLSESNYIRTAIGTTPDTRIYQTKLADYIWFSQNPKVNMLPHMMNPL
jgi:hypothetical protein